MRRRLAELLNDFPELEDVGHTLPRKLGIDPRRRGYVNWPEFCAECELQDLLDTITLAYRHAAETGEAKGYPSRRHPQSFCTEAGQIFKEENVHYRVDARGGVHFRYDAEFEHSRAATITALQGSRYRATLALFEGAMAALVKVPPDGKTAIRDTFGAAEILFKLTFPNSPRLTAGEADKLEPLLQRLYATDKVAISAACKLLSAFKDWVDASHIYRHEAGREEPVQPPLPLALHMVSVGASSVRWLAELDASRG